MRCTPASLLAQATIACAPRAGEPPLILRASKSLHRTALPSRRDGAGEPSYASNLPATLIIGWNSAQLLAGAHIPDTPRIHDQCKPNAKKAPRMQIREHERAKRM